MFIPYTNSIINFRQHVGYRRLDFKLFISYTECRITFVDNSFIVLILFIDIIFLNMRQKHLWTDYTGISWRSQRDSNMLEIKLIVHIHTNLHVTVSQSMHTISEYNDRRHNKLLKCSLTYVLRISISSLKSDEKPERFRVKTTSTYWQCQTSLRKLSLMSH